MQKKPGSKRTHRGMEKTSREALQFRDVVNFLNTGKSTSEAKICLSGEINAVKLPFSVKGWQAQNQ